MTRIDGMGQWVARQYDKLQARFDSMSDRVPWAVGGQEAERQLLVLVEMLCWCELHAFDAQPSEPYRAHMLATNGDSRLIPAHPPMEYRDESTALRRFLRAIAGR